MTISLKKFILKNLELEITSKKIFLIFLFTMYDTAIILLLFWKKFLISLLFIKLSMKLARAISFSSSFFIWLFKINRIYIIIRICFFMSKLNINWFFLFFIVSSKLLLLYFIKISATGWPVAKIFYGIYKLLCVFTALLLQDQTILMRFRSSKLIYELLLI